MIHDILAVALHEDNVRAGIARQTKRDLLKAFRKGNSTARVREGAQTCSTIEYQGQYTHT